MSFKILGNNIPWNNNYECHSKLLINRENLYYNITNILDDINPCDFAKKLNILQRIGSDSKSAEVFLLQVNENNMVIKVLPIINKNSIEKNENEMRIALSASNLVLERSSEHFPLVYFFDECQDVKFYNDKFNTESFTFQSFTFQKKLENESLKSHILISEIFKEDLYTYLQKNHLTIEIINQCLKAIYDLHFKLNVIHNDLHLKNFLVDFKEDKILIVIHDFGQSHFVSEYDIKLYGYDKLDINFFLESLLELEKEINISNEIIDYIKSLIF